MSAILNIRHLPFAAIAALTAASLPAHALVFNSETDKFSVFTEWDYTDYTANGYAMVANNPYFSRNGWSQGVFTDYSRSTDELNASLNGLDWVAKAGYRITGLSVTYSLRYSGTTYLVTGNEFTDFAGGLGAAGTIWNSSALFEASPGPSISFSGAGNTTTSVTSSASGTHFDPSFHMLAIGQNEFAPDGLANWNGYGTVLPTSLELLSVSVTPQVAAIPEPSTYALMLAGIAALSLVTRRTRRSERRH